MTAHGQPINPCTDDVDQLRCIDLQLFLPPAGVGSTFSIDSPGVPKHLSLDLGLAGSFVLTPLSRQRVDGTGEPIDDDEESVVDWLFQAEVLAALGLFEFVELGIALPFTVASALPDANAADPGDAEVVGGPLGDIRLSAKIPILRGDFGLAGRLVISLPTGNDEDFQGAGYWSTLIQAVAAGTVGPLTIAGDVGYRIRRQAPVSPFFVLDDELQFDVGVNVAVVPGLSIIAESQLRVGVQADELRSNIVPWDVNGGVRIAPLDGLQIDLGVGRGLTDGYGAGAFRGFFIVRYSSSPDRCPAGPEDFDGFEDGDFCADPDNDADGVADEVDVCPNDAEDVDGFLDGDGCPDHDNDADGIDDPNDECPRRSEDIDGYQDSDGCPEEDNDGDGLPDGIDACRMEPEDMDAYQDEDGCPEPGPEQATITVTDRRILISERIYFDFDLDTIRPVSQPLLDQVAQVVNRLGRTRRIRVEGYTDNEGEDSYNTDLSYRRARSVVQYLVSRGVPRNRLEFEGYGEANPVAPNDSPEGRALNRRVEFTILEAGE
ncbi:MAG: OmpA family protein [Myxococcota bacterium]